MFRKNSSPKKKRKANQSEAEMGQLEIDVIPPPFYGGNDPEIYHPALKVEKKVQTQFSELIVQKKTLAGQDTAPTQKKSKKKLVFILGGVFVLTLGLISWYYVRQVLPSPAPESQPTSKPVVIIPPTSTPREQPTSTISSLPQPVVTPTSTSRLADSIDFPQILLTTASDIDSDQLTDLEEEVFGTDSGIWDTDKDGYFDGQEVANLYNPKGFAPQRIVDSGLVREYVHPVTGYRLYYPAQWSIGAVDPESRQVLMSAITGDYIQVRMFERKVGETLPQWFARVVVGEQFTGLVPFSNRFQVPAQKRRDGLVAYFVAEDTVYTISYHPGDGGTLRYPHIMEMVIQSFRPTKTTVEIPVQTLLPGTTSTPTSTSTASTTP